MEKFNFAQHVETAIYGILLLYKRPTLENLRLPHQVLYNGGVETFNNRRYLNISAVGLPLRRIPISSGRNLSNYRRDIIVGIPSYGTSTAPLVESWTILGASDLCSHLHGNMFHLHHLSQYHR